ncbi:MULTISPECIES: hypothetical protein [Nocardia]|uniref:hypothetical protein n=1 Tax=Nocardia TaxID=1817 RepID=UPI001C4F4656|nr:hypothetical protein [Nocardia sp. MH4]
MKFNHSSRRIATRFGFAAVAVAAATTLASPAFADSSPTPSVTEVAARHGGHHGGGHTNHGNHNGHSNHRTPLPLPRTGSW